MFDDMMHGLDAIRLENSTFCEGLDARLQTRDRTEGQREIIPQRRKMLIKII
jgi:hypothetical protein